MRSPTIIGNLINRVSELRESMNSLRQRVIYLEGSLGRHEVAEAWQVQAEKKFLELCAYHDWGFEDSGDSPRVLAGQITLARLHRVGEQLDSGRLIKLYREAVHLPGLKRLLAQLMPYIQHLPGCPVSPECLCHFDDIMKTIGTQ